MTDGGQMERTVLGAMLISSKHIAIAKELDPADFLLDANRRIFVRIVAMDGGGLAVDEATLISELTRTAEIEAVGGAGYVNELTSLLPRTVNPASYVKLLRKKALSRKIINLCAIATARAESGDEPDDILDELSGSALQSQMASSDVRPVHISEWVMPTLTELEHERTAPIGQVLGIPTGIADLDVVTTGWRAGELTYVGAIPGRGKTAFLLQGMYEAGIRGIPAGIISLEMRSTQLMRRLLVHHGKVRSGQMRDPRTMKPEEWARAKQALYDLGDLPITGTDVSGLKGLQIASVARQMYDKGARIIFVDFVQIIREDGKDRREAINRVSAALRDTCKALNIPFVVASQLARRDSDENRRPTLQDLKESGNLEQDAHRVLLIYRPKDPTTGEWTKEDQIIIGKAREGVDGHIDVSYDSNVLRFQPRHSGESR